MGRQNSIANLETVWQFLIKLNIHLLCTNPAIPLLTIYPREMQMYVSAKICMQMFMVVFFFIINKNWNWPKLTTQLVNV